MSERKIVTVEDLLLYQEEKKQEFTRDMDQIRKENGWTSPSEFLHELASARFDPKVTYPWEEK